MSIYISFVFCNIQGYPSKLVLPFFHPRAVVFLITPLFSECCSQRHFVAFCANIAVFSITFKVRDAQPFLDPLDYFKCPGVKRLALRRQRSADSRFHAKFVSFQKHSRFAGSFPAGRY